MNQWHIGFNAKNIRKGATIVLFTSYSSADAYSILKMLSDHSDYAPETISTSESLSDIEYFQEAYIDEQHSGFAYVLKEEGGDVKAFATLVKWQEQAYSNCWYVTSLFVENGSCANELALQMLSEIQKAISRDSPLCINVHGGVLGQLYIGLGFILHNHPPFKMVKKNRHDCSCRLWVFNMSWGYSSVRTSSSSSSSSGWR